MRPSDNSPAAKGPTGTAEAHCPGKLPGAGDNASSAQGREAIAEEQVKGCHLQDTEEQDQSDLGSEQSELSSEHESAGAVGDDELLDHEPDTPNCDAERAAKQAEQSVQAWPGKQHGSPLFCHPTAHRICAVTSTQLPAHPDMLTQHQQENTGAMPQCRFGDQGFTQRLTGAAQPQQWPMAPIVMRAQVQHGLQGGMREEHVCREGSRLRAAYRSRVHAEQPHDQQGEPQQQQLQLQGIICQPQLEAVHEAAEAASKAAEEADRQREFFAQPSTEAVPQPMSVSNVPTKVRCQTLHRMYIHRHMH